MLTCEDLPNNAFRSLRIKTTRHFVLVPTICGQNISSRKQCQLNLSPASSIRNYSKYYSAYTIIYLSTVSYFLILHVSVNLQQASGGTKIKLSAMPRWSLKMSVTFSDIKMRKEKQTSI